ncbi:hypothetical protein HY839_00625 [Candidatus Azambacteria bacterium]|nr:hypothetical protein [Candidatus Azambacteria bacterium]
MKKKIWLRIPESIYQKLRHHGGGAQSTTKGDKGYKRADNKRLLREAKKGGRYE